jgi:hypothetical protein
MYGEKKLGVFPKHGLKNDWGSVYEVGSVYGV